ncbi:Membrane-bound lytic murein transglycosylase D [Granulosicoccus antarcticus IMCC3135]|uniref:Membrane-bound lytic murein transglycosylase D n=2 Tax=Granulosicoccus TaxID=437504 RepID=A0A2Z2NUL2_9GAMM|nr:Membrane-bound lytic murein transglycosylase D [Granulosicoccus antarcticus IMCC3135]
MLREIGDTQVFDPSVSPTPAAGCCNSGVKSVKNSLASKPATTVWQFVQQSRRLKIPDKPQIENYRQQYQREALWISKILNRATPFAGHIVESLDKRYLPVELALLPAIESGYQPDVHSTEKAAGIWQIVPITAREIGISSNQWFDGRSDIVKSTDAAISYLSYLNAEFHGDWLLTLAAYNAGPGRVRSAIRRNEKSGQPTDFWSLKLPRETREYVPKFLALVAMLRHDSIPGLEIPLLARGNAFEVLEFGSQTSLDKVAAASGIPEFSLRHLNAGLVHGVTPPGGPHHIYVLKDNAESVISAVTAIDPRDLYTLPATHTVVAGESISTIARSYRLSQQNLMDLNGLNNSFIKIGQELAVRFEADNAASNIEYVVTIGDTISDIAQSFSVPMNSILDAEGRTLDGELIHPGERLLINVDTNIAGI